MVKKLSALLLCFLFLPAFAAATSDSPLLYGDEDISIYYSSFNQDSDDEYVYLNLLLFNKTPYIFRFRPAIVSLNSFSFEMDDYYRVESYSDLPVALSIPREEFEKYPIAALESVALVFAATPLDASLLGHDIPSRTHIIQEPDTNTEDPPYEASLLLLMEHLNSVGGLLFTDENVSIRYSSFYNEKSSDLAYLELIVSNTYKSGLVVLFYTAYLNDSSIKIEKDSPVKIDRFCIYNIMPQSHAIIQIPINKTTLDGGSIEPLERLAVDFEYSSINFDMFVECFDNEPLILQ